MWSLLFSILILPAPQSCNPLIFNEDDQTNEISRRTAWCLARAILSIFMGSKEIWVTVPPPELDPRIDRLATHTLEEFGNTGYTAAYIEPYFCAYFNGTATQIKYYLLFVNRAAQIPEVLNSCYDGSLPGGGAISFVVFPPKHKLSDEDLDHINSIRIKSINIALPTGEIRKPLIVYNLRNKTKLVNLGFDSDRFIKEPVAVARKMFRNSVDNHIRLGVRFIPPFTYDKSIVKGLKEFETEPKYHGIEIAILMKMNFDIVYSENHNLGECNDSNGSCTDLLGELLNDEIDILVGGLGSQFARNMFEPSYPILSSKFVAIVRNKAVSLISCNNQTNIFTREVCILYLLCFVISISLDYLAKRRASSPASLPEICLFWYSVALGMPGKKVNTSYMSLLFVMFVWVSFVMRSVYQMYMTTLLLQRNSDSNLNHILDLCRENYTALVGSTFHKTFTKYGMNAHLCTMTSKNFVLCKDPLKCLYESPVDGKFFTMIYLSSYRSQLYKYVTPEADNVFHVLDEVISLEPISFLLKKGDPLLELIKIRGGMLSSYGSITFLLDFAERYVATSLPNSMNKIGMEADFTALSMRHVDFLFVYYWISAALAVVVFVLEHVMYRLSK